MLDWDGYSMVHSCSGRFIVLGVLNNRVLAPKVIKPELGKAYTRFEKCDPPLGTFKWDWFLLV